MFLYFKLFAYVFGSSLIPIFGPPSWIFVIYFKQRYHLDFFPTILLGAFSTTMGRLALAKATQASRRFIPSKYRANLDATREVLEKRQGSTWLFISLFVVSPLPSAQLFEAAGLIDAPLWPLGLAFFLGRLVTYAIYLSVANVTIGNIDNIWQLNLRSPLAIALQLTGLLTIILIANYKWVIKKLAAYL